MPGMFLFAKLVMTNLYGQVSRAGLMRELEPHVYPTGLEQAYVVLISSSLPPEKSSPYLECFVTTLATSIHETLLANYW